MAQHDLPKAFQRLVVDNLWWLAIARLIVGVTILGLLGNLTVTDSTSAQILLVMFGVITLLTVPAIFPLMKHKKLGWTLIFLTMPVQAIGISASLFVSSNMILMGAIVGAIVGTYVLLDIRKYYS